MRGASCFDCPLARPSPPLGARGRSGLLHRDLALDEQAAGAAAGVVDFHAGLGGEDPGHNDADLGRGVELAGALAAALGELADEVFVALADDVGLDVVEPEALGADGLDEVGEAVVVEVALAVGGGVEVDAVDDALQERVFPGDGPHVGGDAFADLVGELADDGPDRLLGIVRQEREVEADELVVGPGELEGLLARTDLGGDAVHLVVEDVAEALGEDEREDEVLVFRCVLGPADGAGGVPDPGLEGFPVSVIVCHQRSVLCFYAYNGTDQARLFAVARIRLVRCGILTHSMYRHGNGAKQSRVISELAETEPGHRHNTKVRFHDLVCRSDKLLSSPEDHPATQDNDIGKIDSSQISQSLPQIVYDFVPLLLVQAFSRFPIDAPYAVAGHKCLQTIGYATLTGNLLGIYTAIVNRLVSDLGMFPRRSTVYLAIDQEASSHPSAYG